MTSREENELLTQTGPGTPGGELLRRYWQPVAVAEELSAGSAPLPVRILGEDLVLFRDDNGVPGLLGIHCAHRGADLSYGRLEDGGLRCIYHGWLYDVEGRCLEQPGEPAGSTFHERIRQTAYPCVEVGGLIMTYMGPGDPPELPPFEFLYVPAEQRMAHKNFRACNFQQGNEGNIDPQHLGLLHWGTSMPEISSAVYHRKGPKPTIEVEDTDFGVRLYTMVPFAPDRNYVKLTYFILPNLSAFEGSATKGLDGYGVNWHVPIDDETHWVYTLLFDRRSTMVALGANRGPNGLVPRERTKENRYLQNRDSMKSETFAGLGSSFGEQDACVIEGAGPIWDRTQEHPGSTDRAIIAARRQYLRAVQDVQEGRTPPLVDHGGAAPSIVVTREEIPASADWRAHLRAKLERTPEPSLS